MNNLYRDAVEADPGCHAAIMQKWVTIYRDDTEDPSDFVADIAVQSGDEKTLSLLLAAPDLLEACMSVSAYPGTINADLELIGDAIAKATGVKENSRPEEQE